MKTRILPLLVLTTLTLPLMSWAEPEVIERNQAAAGSGSSADNSRLNTRTGKKMLPDTVSSSNPANENAPLAPGGSAGYTPDKFKKRMGTPIVGTVNDISPPTQGNTPNDELERSTGVSVVFAPGQAALSDEAKQQIDGLLGVAKTEEQASSSMAGVPAMPRPSQKVESVKVVSWGDTHQDGNKKSLSKDEQNLASKRNEALIAYVKTKMKNTPVKAYNMARKPGLITQIFDTNEKRIRERLGLDALSAPADGGGSRAMVLMILRH